MGTFLIRHFKVSSLSIYIYMYTDFGKKILTLLCQRRLTERTFVRIYKG
jgi:hypothetical protein